MKRVLNLLLDLLIKTNKEPQYESEGGQSSDDEESYEWWFWY